MPPRAFMGETPLSLPDSDGHRQGGQAQAHRREEGWVSKRAGCHGISLPCHRNVLSCDQQEVS